MTWSAKILAREHQEMKVTLESILWLARNYASELDMDEIAALAQAALDKLAPE